MEISHAIVELEQHANLWGEHKYKLRQTYMHMNKIKLDIFYYMKAVLAYITVLCRVEYTESLALLTQMMHLITVYYCSSDSYSFKPRILA